MQRPNALTILAIAICLAVLFFVVPLFWLAVLVYVVFLLILGWSAVRYRGAGWVSGLLFVGLCVSIPVWVGVGYLVFCWVSGSQELK
jgi:hypothetical protein